VPAPPLVSTEPGGALHPDQFVLVDLVERRFREITNKAIRRGSFGSVDDLIAAIEQVIRVHNDDPKPFMWTATAEKALVRSDSVAHR
jgi:hypothetical protein